MLYFHFENWDGAKSVTIAMLNSKAFESALFQKTIFLEAKLAVFNIALVEIHIL